MGFRFSLLADTQDKTTFLHLVFYDGYVGQLFGFGISCTSLKKETLHSETSLNKTFWYILRPTQQLSDYLFINNIPVTLIPHSLILACKRLIISRMMRNIPNCLLFKFMGKRPVITLETLKK